MLQSHGSTLPRVAAVRITKREDDAGRVLVFQIQKAKFERPLALVSDGVLAGTASRAKFRPVRATPDLTHAKRVQFHQKLT